MTPPAPILLILTAMLVLAAIISCSGPGTDTAPENPTQTLEQAPGLGDSSLQNQGVPLEASPGPAPRKDLTGDAAPEILRQVTPPRPEHSSGTGAAAGDDSLRTHVSEQSPERALAGKATGEPGSGHAHTVLVPTVEELISRGQDGYGVTPSHIVIQGSPVADSIRCRWRTIARTLEQREGAIRHWLDLDNEDEIPDMITLEGLFKFTLEALDPPHMATAKSNFMALVKGDVSDDFQYLSCFADYTVSNYVLGDGPATVTVGYDRVNEATSYDLYKTEHGACTY